MEFLDHLHFLLWVGLEFCKVKPFNEVILVYKELRHEHVEKRPKLTNIVLERCTSKQQARVRWNLAACLRYFRIAVFEFVSFVKDDIMEIVLGQRWTTNQNSFISGDTNIEVPRLHLVSDDLVSMLRSWNKVDNFEKRSPSLELFHPIRNCRLGSDNKVRLFDFHSFLQVGKDWNCLDCLSHTHIICKNSVDSIFIEWCHPLQRIKLVGLKFTALAQTLWLSYEAYLACLIFSLRWAWTKLSIDYLLSFWASWVIFTWNDASRNLFAFLFIIDFALSHLKWRF